MKPYAVPYGVPSVTSFQEKPNARTTYYAPPGWSTPGSALNPTSMPPMMPPLMPPPVQSQSMAQQKLMAQMPLASYSYTQPLIQQQYTQPLIQQQYTQSFEPTMNTFIANQNQRDFFQGDRFLSDQAFKLQNALKANNLPLDAAVNLIRIQASLPPFPWKFQDAPRPLLGKGDQDSYLSAISFAYAILLGVGLNGNDKKILQKACMPFNVDEDTIAVVESQLETILFQLSKTQTFRYGLPLLSIPPLFEKYLSEPLRLFVYSEVEVNRNRTLENVDTFTWRHSLDLKLDNEVVSKTELKLRREYNDFLVKLYSAMWKSMMERRSLALGKINMDYNMVIETTLSQMAPEFWSVATLEAKIRSIAARFQLMEGLFFNTSRYMAFKEKFQFADLVILDLIQRYSNLI